MENVKEFDLGAFAGGAVSEWMQDAIQKIYEDIADPNTEADKARKLTIDLIFKPSKAIREMVDVQMVAKTTLQPRKLKHSPKAIAKAANNTVLTQEQEKDVMRGQQELCIEKTTEIVAFQKSAK